MTCIRPAYVIDMSDTDRIVPHVPAQVLPVLVETITDRFGTLHIIWMCEPPASGQVYCVTSQTWSDDFTERTIHAWRNPGPPATGPLGRRTP